MNRTLCVIAMLVAAQVVSGEARAEPARGDAPVMLGALSPGRLMLGLDGGGDGEQKPPLEPGRMALEALMGLPAYVVYALIDVGLIRVFGSSVSPLRSAGLIALIYAGQPAATAVLQVAIGNTSATTRVAFLPSFVAGLVANAVVLSAAFLLVSRDKFAGVASGLKGFVVLGTPVIQMVALNEFREAKPLDSQTKLAWPEPAWATAAQSRGVTIPLASLCF